MSGNNITDKMAIRILAAIKKGILREIDLSYNKLTEGFFEYYIKESKSFKSLTYLNLGKFLVMY